jgi:hypothetical protein
MPTRDKITLTVEVTSSDNLPDLKARVALALGTVVEQVHQVEAMVVQPVKPAKPVEVKPEPAITEVFKVKRKTSVTDF